MNFPLKALLRLKERMMLPPGERSAATNMSEFLRKYWFICLLSIVLIGVLIYYIVDLNKDNVSGKRADGTDVVASLNIGDVTSDNIFDRYQNFNQSLLYNMYRNAVVDQSVEADSEMKETAHTMAKNIKANMEADSTGKTRVGILSELASYGFNGIDSLEDYCLMTLKQKDLNWNYVSEHFDEYKDSVTTSPRTISIITMEVPNAEILTEEGEEKKNNIDQALKNGDSFESVATSFSEDPTAADGGFYGYIDSSTTALDSAVIEAAAALNKGETSEWITTQKANSSSYVLYRVYVNETDLKEIFNSENDSVSGALLSAMITANPGLETRVVKNAADGLEITFDNEEVKSQIESYIKTQIGDETE